MYVPRDERFEELKQNTFSVKRLKGVLHNLLPGLKSSLSADNQDFNDFSDVDGLYSVGLLIKLGLQDDVLKKFPLPKIVGKIKESTSQGVLKYDIPKIISSKYDLFIFNVTFYKILVRHNLIVINFRFCAIVRLTRFPRRRRAKNIHIFFTLICNVVGSLMMNTCIMASHMKR